MPDYQLALIRQYCNTEGRRLSSEEKDLLCMILENPDQYDGYVSQEFVEEKSGRDYRDTWDSIDIKQYRISISNILSIDFRHYHACDGFVQGNWDCDWDNAYHITDIRRVVDILKQMF